MRKDNIKKLIQIEKRIRTVAADLRDLNERDELRTWADHQCDKLDDLADQLNTFVQGGGTGNE